MSLPQLERINLHRMGDSERALELSTQQFSANEKLAMVSITDSGLRRVPTRLFCELNLMVVSGL